MNSNHKDSLKDNITEPKLTIRRNRLFYFLSIVFVITLGLFSRSSNIRELVPKSVDLILGDSLWALMIYLIFSMIFSSWPIKKIVVTSALFCFIIELSQLYHSPWIDIIRSTTLGGLILGYGFLYSDLAAYLNGIFIGSIFEVFLYKIFIQHPAKKTMQHETIR